MGETTVNKLPFPEDKDVPNGPAQIKALAELLDTLKWGSRNLKPTCGVKTASASLTLTTSYQDIAGLSLEITPAVASILLVTAVFDFSLFVRTEGQEFTLAGQGDIKVDSASETGNFAILDDESGTGGRASVTQVYALPLTAAAHTIKMRAKKQGNRTALANEVTSRMLYQLVAS